MAHTPTLDKMLAVKDDSQKIGEFLEHLQSNNIVLCKFEETDEARGYFPLMKSTEQILADYFEIDLLEADKEKKAILKELQE